MLQNDEQNSGRRRPRRRVHFDGVIEETTVMGRVFTIPAEPRRRAIDLSLGADGWEPLGSYLARRRDGSGWPSVMHLDKGYWVPRRGLARSGSALHKASRLFRPG